MLHMRRFLYCIVLYFFVVLYEELFPRETECITRLGRDGWQRHYLPQSKPQTTALGKAEPQIICSN